MWTTDVFKDGYAGEEDLSGGLTHILDAST